MDPRPKTDPQPRATSAVVVTAESRHRSRSLQPTVLRRVGGVTLLDRTVKVLREAGVTRIVVVAGYRSEDVRVTIPAGCGRRRSPTRLDSTRPEVVYEIDRLERELGRARMPSVDRVA